ncbi:MAG: hypothetical protein ACNA7V_10230 [Bacteroidales bacterium]
MKSMRFLRNLIAVLLGMTLMMTVACNKEEEEVKETTISDNDFYMMVGYTMINCYTDIYNQNLAGVATGGHNITTDGPMGGSVLITGTTTYDNTHGITTTDLVLAMNAVNYIYSHTNSNGRKWTANITLTGSTTYTGSFSNTYTSVNHQANNLQITGMVIFDGVTRSINGIGAVSINRSSKIAVNIFGHIVSW